MRDSVRSGTARTQWGAGSSPTCHNGGPTHGKLAQNFFSADTEEAVLSTLGFSTQLRYQTWNLASTYENYIPLSLA